MMLEAKTSGKRNEKPIVITVIGVRMRRPRTMKYPARTEADRDQKQQGCRHAEDPCFRPIAENEANGENDERGDEMPQDITDHKSGEGCQRPDRQRAKAIKESLAEIAWKGPCRSRPN